jgi:hypothetical protein
VLGELRYMMSNMKNLTGDIDEKERLELFFLLLEKFNYGRHINHDLQNQIRAFMEIKWYSDKNNFLLTEDDQSLLNQLPDTCITNIYIDFLYKDFLFKFRRFFNIHIQMDNLFLSSDIKGDIKVSLSKYDNLRKKKIPFPFYTFNHP